MSTYEVSNLKNSRLFYLIFPNCDALRHELTWIERIFTDNSNPCASAQSVFHPKNPNNHESTSISVHPQLNESNQLQQKAQSIATIIFASFALWYEKKINNELVRTPYELTLPEFVSVRFSSLFFSCSFMNERFIANFAVRFINSLNELSSIAAPSAFISVHPRFIYRTTPAEGR